jgi:hypothetical protein
VRHVAHQCRPGFQSELGRWLEDSPRFKAFLSAHQDKVRKKLASADEESRQDVRAELLVAYLILVDRRFEVSFEAYGAHRLGPDLTVSYRVNQRFNLEVTRLRAVDDAGPGDARLANVIAAKLRQLPNDLPNALVMTTRGLPISEDNLAAAIRLLKTHNDVQDDAFFARRGFPRTRDFHAQYRNLGGVIALDEAAGSAFLANREAKHPLPPEALAGLMICLRPGEASIRS